jgi:4-hydroxy-tetrahydrodipicolinate synthase
MAPTVPIFSGVAVPLVTIFQANGDVDARATGELAARLIDAGVKGVVVADSWGEGPSLTPDERLAVIDGVRAAVPDSSGVPLIAATGAPSARQAIQLTRAAVDHGVEAVLVHSPPLSSDPEMYFHEVAKAADGAAVIAVHDPHVSWPGLDLPDVVDLPIAALEDNSGDAEHLLESIIVFDGAVYTGSTPMLALAGPAGATGAIAALANADPEACSAAFGGDGPAQRRLLREDVAIRTDFPGRLKVLTAHRFGMSTATRMG